jgi:signal transduction histidine kinase
VNAVPGQHVRRGSLRARLIWSFAVVALVVAFVTGVTTLSLLRSISERDAEGRLRAQAAALVDDGGVPAELQICSIRNALRVSGTELYLVRAGGAQTLPRCRQVGDPAAPAPEVDLAEALRAGHTTTGTTGALSWAVAPVSGRPGRFDGLLLVRRVNEVGTDLVRLVASRLLLGSLLGVVLAAVTAWVLSGRLARPLSRLAGAARQLGRGRLETRVPLDGDDEVAAVAAAFNDMAASLARHQAEERVFLASVGHELRTPLTVVQGNAEALLDGAVEDEAGRRRSVQRIHAEALRLARLVQDLLDLGRLGTGHFVVALDDGDAAAVLREAGEVAAERGAGHDVPVEVRVPDRLPATIDPGRLRQVLDNLLDNAVRSNPAGRAVLLAARALDDGRVEVLVADQGPGIAAEDLPHAFERGWLWSRYRATRSVGSGLGLAIVKGLCDAMGASVWAERGEHGGLLVHLVLPGPSGQPAPVAPQA